MLSLIGFVPCLQMMLMISAGWTLVAIAFVAAVYWVMKRRAMRAMAQGDMRVGLLMFGARVLMRRLARHTGGERNWRPNLLVLAGAPTRRWHD